MILWWRELHISVQVRCTQILQKSGHFLQIVGAGSVTRSNFHTDDPQCWSGLWTSLLSDVFCLVRVDWQMLFVCTEKTAIIALKILSASVHNSFGCSPGIWDLHTPGIGDLWIPRMRYNSHHLNLKTRTLEGMCLFLEGPVSTVVLTVHRPQDSRLEERDLAQLFSALCVPSLLKLFSSLLLERKVILISNSLR